MYDGVISLFDTFVSTEQEIIVKYTISGVHIENVRNMVLVKDGLNKKDSSAIVIMPEDTYSGIYVDSKTWLSMSENEKVNHFTLRAGQCIVNGDVSTDATSLDDIFNEFADSYRVTGVARFDDVFPHIEVVVE